MQFSRQSSPVFNTHDRILPVFQKNSSNFFTDSPRFENDCEKAAGSGMHVAKSDLSIFKLQIKAFQLSFQAH